MCRVQHLIFCATMTILITEVSPVGLDKSLAKFLGTKDKGMENDSCSGAKCQEPPKGKDTGECQIVSNNDKSIPRPTGKHAKCCPLWKCEMKDDPDAYFTYHGYDEGSETVHYKKTNGTTTAYSSAEGDHDATAIAMDDVRAEDSGNNDQLSTQMAGYFSQFPKFSMTKSKSKKSKG